MRVALIRPCLANLDLFTGALLVALGVPSQVGCGAEVSSPNDGANSGSGGGATGGGATTSTATGGQGATSVGSTGGSGPTSAVSGTTSSTGVGGASSGGCEDPKPVIVNGQDTGIDVCNGGQFRRREALECPTNYPDTNPCCGGCEPGFICNTSGEIACTCVPACTNDADCGPNSLCLCGNTAGICVPAKCQTGADCAPGEECTSWDYTLGCLYYEFACTTPADTCGGDLDCPASNQFCGVQPDGHRECVDGGCAIGRPFLVHQQPRTAAVVRRSDWADGIALPEHEVDPALRPRLADAWEHIGRMEHASIAAFARFSLQLLSLGAPVELVERTNHAMADETMHARAAFALASAYRGAPVGPGRLAIEGALEDAADLESVIRLVVREGCVGETVAAVEAAEAAARAEDTAVSDVLGRIASDEAEHAELAWHTLKWALEVAPDAVRAIVTDELAVLESELLASTGADDVRAAGDDLLLRHGVVTDARRAAIRAAVVGRAVIPCLRALATTTMPAAA